MSEQREVQPVLGARAKRAIELSADWDRKVDRKVFVLLAAFGDAGENSPFARDLAQRIGIDVEQLDRALSRLAADGWIWTVRRRKTRNFYCLLVLGDEVPAHDVERFQAYERQRPARAGRRERVAA